MNDLITRVWNNGPSPIEVLPVSPRVRSYQMWVQGGGLRAATRSLFAPE